MMSLRVYFAAVVFVVSFAGCGTGKYTPHKKESTAILVMPGEPINQDTLEAQSLAYEQTGKSRGMLDFIDPTAYGSTGVTLLATGVKNLIEKEQRKYQASYSHRIGGSPGRKIHDDSLYFYRENSTSGPFDLKGLQFYSFSFGRLLENKKDHKHELAMRAVFEIDTTNLCEIVYDGIFRLRLKELELNYAKAKVPRGRKKINLDIEVKFMASYITKDGHFYDDAVLGTFTKNLAGIVIQDPSSFKKFEDEQMDGWSFVVPRSYVRMRGKDIWNKGAYSILVTVKETAKPRYVNKIAVKGSESFIDASNKALNIKSLLVPQKSGPSTGANNTKPGAKK